MFALESKKWKKIQCRRGFKLEMAKVKFLIVFDILKKKFDIQRILRRRNFDSIPKV